MQNPCLLQVLDHHQCIPMSNSKPIPNMSRRDHRKLGQQIKQDRHLAVATPLRRHTRPRTIPLILGFQPKRAQRRLHRNFAKPAMGSLDGDLVLLFLLHEDG